MKYKLREARTEEIPLIKILFSETILTTGKNDYSSKQLKVWSTIENEEYWNNLIMENRTIIALKNNEVIGYSILMTPNYLNHLFVHKNYIRKGIASCLLEDVINFLQENGKNKLYTDASITAKPFFEKFGFKQTKENSVIKNGESLTNFTMVKILI